MKHLAILLFLIASEGWKASFGFTWTTTSPLPITELSPTTTSSSSTSSQCYRHHTIFRNRSNTRKLAPSLSMLKIVHSKDDHNTRFQRALLRLGRGIMFAKPVGPTCAQALFGLSIKSKRKNDKENTSSSVTTSLSFTLKECLIAIAIYLGVGVTFYSIIMENWSIIDSIYFSIVVFTTVGYGDLVPQNPAAKLFTCFFSLGGIAFLAAALAAIGSSIVKTEIKTVRAAKRMARRNVVSGLKRFLLDRKKEKVVKSVANDAVITAVVPFTPPPIRVIDHQSPPPPKSSVIEVMARIVPRLGLLVAMGLLFGRIEGWSIVDSVYFGLTTAGTIGFGDKAPTLQSTRLLASLCIPISVAIGGEILGTIAAAFLKHRRAQLFDTLVKKDFSIEHIKEMDRNGDGEVSKLDYMEFMLAEMQLVDKRVLEELGSQFDRLDMTRAGSLSKKDLILMAKLRRIKQEGLDAAPAEEDLNASDSSLDAGNLKSAHIQEDVPFFRESNQNTKL